MRHGPCICAFAPGAYLVFAEHRFFGASVPNGSLPNEDCKVGQCDACTHMHAHMQTRSQAGQCNFLSHELALADYAVLIRTIKDEIGAPKYAHTRTHAPTHAPAHAGPR
jgi:hypothetical protein